MSDVVEKFLKKGILISPDIKAKIKPEEVEEIATKLDEKSAVLTEDCYCFIRGKGVKVIEEYKKGEEVKRITNFVDFYNKRFEFLREILKAKLEVEKITSINKLNYGSVVVIGMVRERKEDGFTIEDSTGSVFCVSDKKMLEDEVIAVSGNFSKAGLKEEKIFYPDIPLSKKVNTTEDDCHAIFTKKFSKKPSRASYIFTFESSAKSLDGLKSWVITKKENVSKGQKRLGLNLPSVVDVDGIRIFVFETDQMDEIKKKLNMDDEKKIIISLLKRRHLSPFVYMNNDPYLLKEIPDIIFFAGSKSFFLNYKGVSVISVSGDKGFLVNLKTREYEELNEG